MMEDTLSTHNADCTLTVTAAHQAEDALHLAYKVKNNSELPLYLCSQLYELDTANGSGASTAQLNPDLVHIQVEPLGVKLDKAIMDLSFREGLQVLDIPYLNEVQPGQTFEQSFRVALPLQPYRAYGQRPGPAAAIPLHLWFTLGYFRGVPAVTAALTPASAAGMFELDHFQRHNEELVAVGPFTTPVLVANAKAGPAPTQPTAPERWTPWS